MTKSPIYQYDFTASSAPPERICSSEVSRLRITRKFFQRLPPTLADLLDVTIALYAADRRSPRSYYGIRTGQRRIGVRIGVRDPDIWNDTEVQERLQILLYWLTQDEWSLIFQTRKSQPRLAELEQFLFNDPAASPETVSLFSGGLDSLAGLATAALEGHRGSSVLVSAYTNSRLFSLQRKQVRLINSAWGKEGNENAQRQVLHVAAPLGLEIPPQIREEGSQRTRAIVYLAVGVATAMLAGSDALHVYENGIGALNLPMNETQLGVDNYRSVHPLSLMMTEEFFSIVLGQSVRIRNPFLFTTKAEMCRALSSRGLIDAVELTVSCDGFPQRVKDSPSQCGYCTSCILRRQAFLASGLAECDSTRGYRMDALGKQEELNAERRYGLNAMRNQVYRLSTCLKAADPWGMLTVSYPELARTQAALAKNQSCDAEEFKAGTLRLYKQYVQEWQPFM